MTMTEETPPSKNDSTYASTTIATTMRTTTFGALPTTDVVAKKSQVLPKWVIILLVICAVLVFACCIGIIVISRRYIVSLKAKVAQVQMEKGKQVTEKQLNRYYDISTRNNEWEIDRRFVSIDYTQKLGEGAFGSVYKGPVLAKNIPSVIGRSIIKLSSLTNDSDFVAVKTLHGLGFDLHWSI
ncbi:hypothetical protein PMAYCL1PPCAC_19495, partial [Pristionchus mayeri]